MIAIAVDDEVLMLGALTAAIESSNDISEVAKFSNCEKALEFVKDNPVDVAFWISICAVWADLSLLKELSTFVQIAKSYFAQDMRNMPFLHLSFMRPDI
jgi:chemotaxis response regulator CheB